MRVLTKGERIEARHLLQELSETARMVRNSMDPQHGMMRITNDQWVAQYESMTAQLRYFTQQVMEE